MLASLKGQEGRCDMSLGIIINGPEGIVLAAESRITLGANVGGKPIPVFFDNATKLLSFMEPNTTVGAVTYGQAIIGLQNPRTAASFLPEFEGGLPKGRLSVKEFAEKLSGFFMKQWEANMPSDYKGPSMTFVVAGFNSDDVYGQVHLMEIPSSPSPVERSAVGEFGITFGGQNDVMNKVLTGYDARLPDELTKGLKLAGEQIETMKGILNRFQSAIPLQVLALQDCVDLAISFIRTTMEVQRFTIGIRGVGGATDVAIITRNKDLKFVQRKEIHGDLEQ